MKQIKFTILLIICINNFPQLFGQFSPVASYKFNGNANDGSGNGNHGSINGASLTTDRFGNENSAYFFNGLNNYISIPASNISTPEYTYSAWVNTNSQTLYAQAIVSVGNLGADQTLLLFNPNGSSNNQFWDFFSYLYYQALPIPEIQVNANNIANNWYSLVATRTLSELRLYVNGQLIGLTSSGNVSPLYASPSSAAIGTRSRKDIQFFSGKIDDVSIYNRALSASEVIALYKYESTPSLYSEINQSSLILQVNNPVNDFIFNVGVSQSQTNEVFTIKGNGNIGINNSSPKSKLDVNGSFGTKLKKITENGTIILDETATIWSFSNNGSITLPNPADCINRRYLIINRNGNVRYFTNNFVDFSGNSNNYFLPNSSIEVVSDGTNWLQIK